MDAHQRGGGYGRRPDYLTGTRVPDREKNREMSGENSGAEAGAPIFSMHVCLSPPPHVLEVTGDLDKEDRRVGGRGTTLGRGLRDAAAGSTSDSERRVFLLAFPLLSSARPKSRGS